VVGPLYQTARDLGDGTKLAAWHAIDNVKIFNLNIAPQDVETAPGVIKKAIGINGTVPAPTIRVNEGDRVRFVVHNQMAEPTSIHWHGMDLPNNEDGVPGITRRRSRRAAPSRMSGLRSARARTGTTRTCMRPGRSRRVRGARGGASGR